MKPFQLEGVWWLPSNPTQQVGGILSYSHEEGIRLRIFGSLGRMGFSDLVKHYRSRKEPITESLIHGATSSMKIVTLQECVYADSTNSSNGYESQIFNVSLACFGKHFSSSEEIAFSAIRVRFSRLAEWSGLSGFHMPALIDSRSAGHTTIYEYPPEVNIKYGDVDINIETELRGEVGFNRRLLTQLVWLNINEKRRLKLEEWADIYLSKIQNLLSFATGVPNTITDVLFHAEPKEGENNTPGNYFDIETVFQLVYPGGKGDLENKTLWPNDVLFTTRDVEDIDTIFSKWIKASETYKPVFDLYFGFQYAPPQYLDTRFLLIAQAIEAYHRYRFPGGVLSKSEYRAKKKAIIESTPDEHKEWLKDKLSHGNEPTLAERLSGLLELCNDVCSELIPDRASFIRKVRDTRNYHTHYSDSLKAKAVKGEEMYWITEILLCVLQRCFLDEIGFDSERCKMVFSRNKQYQLILQISKHNNNKI